jgi:hypothetical protein
MTASSSAFEPLHAPPDALEKGGTEVLRAAILTDGNLQVTLRRAFDEPEVWGLLLADVARHAARIFAAEAAVNEDSALQRIRSMFEAEMDSATDIGTTNSIS